MKLKLFNTLTRKKETFKPLKDSEVSLYTCGPTVYNYAHVGNLRTYVFEDILRRTLEYNKYNVNHVMNITDVGHLVSDADTGEDKMEKSAKEEKRSVMEVSEYYTKAFQNDLAELNIKTPVTWCKATDHIQEQIDLVKKLEENGYAYTIDDGVYFDTAKFKDYGYMARLDIKGQRAGARVEIVEGKKNPTDFALWKFSPKDGTKRQMEWDSPWGVGFPGWAIECSAMSTKYLGQPFDIHTGGIDHIPVHHTNEIAQSEAANNTKMANYWLHGEFLIMKDEKMAKSKGNFITLQTLKEKGINPLAYRYLLLTTHYRSKLIFNWKNLDAAISALDSLYEQFKKLDNAGGESNEDFEKQFVASINDDLNTPKALALVWKLLKSSLPSATKRATLLKFDQVLGLQFASQENIKLEVPKLVKTLATKRERARRAEEFEEADRLRKEIEENGFTVTDTANGPRITKKK
ncbi:cysteine--tRNA ligase [Patescibacteria group bacterium]|nr:cysteine--tRNA ligase [Patescibacteria group bacterium]MBU2229504.1 cysteine--tRNA ligase [Patescibacteria group bacterium]